MGSSNNNIEDFQRLLQKQGFKKPSFLYNKDLNPSEESYEPQDVIQTVCSQIKAYQLADYVKSVKSGCKDWNQAKKSNFLPLNKLPVYRSKMQEVPKENPHKFETQCVLDTQLMDIIDGTATIDANMGMTQEFDTTFTHNDVRKSENTKQYEKDKNYVETDTNDDEKQKVISVLDKKSENVSKSGKKKDDIDMIAETKKTNEDSKIDHDIAMLLDDSIDVNMEQNSQLAETATEDTVTFIDNLLITQELNEESEKMINRSKKTDMDRTTCMTETDMDTGQGIERSPSPILNIKAIKRKLKTPPPLIVALEAFENFENVAMSLIKNTDFKTAKYLINSQILGKELCLDDDADILLGIERDKSPVFDFKSDELQLNSNELIPAKTDKVLSLQYIKDITEKPSEVLKDEILFSSDEEDFAQEEPQALPPTCALEIYSKNKTDILEKSMFVGFQTASNKSIEISGDSYKQAQIILSNHYSKAVEEFSLKELVEKCDNLKPTFENITNKAPKTKEACITKDVESVLNEFEDKIKKKEEHKCSNEYNEQTEMFIPNSSRNTKIVPLEKQSFDGFMTASNKTICMSDRALERCQNVFKDIDLNENFDAIEISENTDSAVEKKSCSNKTEEKIDVFLNADDKINDELLLEEFENIEMSLEEKESDSKAKEPVAFEGFKTANNKNVTISEEAMMKSKNIFQDIDLELKNQKNVDDQSYESYKKYVNQSSTSTTEFVGFKTANNNEIKISDEAFAKSKDVFKDIGKNKHKVKTIDDMISQPTTSKINFVGFKTANNKDIRISNDALSKTKHIFKDIDKEQTRIEIPINANQPSTSKTMLKKDSNKDNSKSDAPLSESEQILEDIAEDNFIHCEFDDPEPAFKGFKTGSDIEVKISQQAIEKQRQLFNDIIIDDNDSAKIISEKTEPDFVGFKTANNKAVKISAEEVEKCKNIFVNLDLIDPNEENRLFTDKNDEKNSGLKDFQTASKKPVTVSAYALAKSKRLYKDIDEVNDSTPEKIAKKSAEILENNKNIFLGSDPISSSNKTQLYKDKDEHFSFKGFQTASKKPVKVSADALAKSKIIFKDIDETNDSISEKIPNTTSFILKGFQTGNKKPVDINQKALIASKMLLDDLSNQKEDSRNDFVGFKTARIKDVNISEEAFAKSKKILDDIEDIHIAANVLSELKPKEEIFRGFQTANKIKVEVVKESLKKAKNLFDMNVFAKEDSGKSFAGFQTANNNKVTVSEQALAKSRKIFQDIDTKSDDTLSKIDNSVPDKDASEKFGKNYNFEFKTGFNEDITVFEDFEKGFAEHVEKDKKYVEERKTVYSKDLEIKKDTINIDKILNTQVVNDFEEDVCTEDFKDTSRPNKRSASPILFCPKAKKRKKFETPYKMNPKTITDIHKDTEVPKQTNITFKEHYKKNKKYTLKDLTDFEKGNNKTDPYIFNFTLENILNFEFDEDRNDYKEGKTTIEELKQIFTEGTDKKLIPDGWLDIHLKLILWKLISYEIRFPNALGKVCTVKNVIDQLKYRYDKELYNAERSVLRKILEKDDVPNKTMVLCVAGVYLDGASVVSATNLNNIELLLTDGWYFIKATIDNLLSKLVYDEKIVVGKKIVTCGAELVNCEQGVAPWEDTSAIRLSIFGNSTRPARWHEKLGLRPYTMVSGLSSVRVGGGKVARLRASVVRVYPRLYVEKFQDGSTVTRSERLENQYQMKYEAEREAMIEKIYEEVEKEMSDQESQDSDSISDPGSKRKHLESGSQIAKLMKNSRDPAEFRAQLTSSQINLLQDHNSKQRDRYLQAIQDRVQERLQARNVVPLARGRVAGLERDGDNVTVTKGMLSIWKPNDEVLDIFKEGSWIEVMNVVPTAFRNSEIHLSAGRQSVFRAVKCKEDIFKPYLISLSRNCYTLKDLSQNPSMTTDYNEIDTVGMIFSIDPSNRDFDSNKNQFQNVYLADVDKNMIGVNFWGGIKKFGYENILDTGQVIYCGNLQKRAGNTRKNVPQFRATEFAIFTKTPKNEKGREMVDEMNKKLFGLDRRKFCEDCIAIKQNYSVIRCLNDSKNVTPYRFNYSDYNLGRNKVFIETPVGVKVKNKVEDFNLTGLDFESTFKQQETQLSPRTLERKKKVNERIAKLKMYGEPPALNSINIINKSKNATNSYKSPLLKDQSDISNSASVAIENKLQDVVTPIKLPDDTVKTNDTESSPIISNISMNRTYVKRSINPVKLSFGNTEQSVDKIIDHFEEDFEGSPPLSLE